MTNETTHAAASESVISTRAQRTPGSVRIDPKAACRIVAGKDDTIANTAAQSDLRDQWEANAAFIVRAWNAHDDMLASLIEIISACDVCGKDDDLSLVDTFTEDMENRARAAIAKATQP